MFKFVKDALTGVDGQSYAIAKIAGILIVFVFLGLSVASYVQQETFDMAAFGLGAGAAVAAMGAAIKLTETSEPKEKHNDTP